MGKADHITLAIPYFDAPEMLQEQVRYWKGYDNRVRVILIDDGSPQCPAMDVLDAVDQIYLNGINLSVYRIEQNIPWNYSGTRNLAFLVADPGWVFSTDLDHIVPNVSINEMFGRELNDKCYYIPKRIQNGLLMKRHSDSFIMTKHLYWSVGGYDEDFAGWYGGATQLFRMSLRNVASEISLGDVWHEHYTEDMIQDCHTTVWGRKGSEYDFRKNPDLVNKIAYYKRNKSDKKKCLRFDWKQVL